MRSRELISLDIDGVCAQTNEEMARQIARASKMDFRFEDISDYSLRHLIERWGMAPEMVEATLALYRDPNFYRELQPYLSAQTATLILVALGYDLAMHSSRTKDCAQVTRPGRVNTSA